MKIPVTGGKDAYLNSPIGLAIQANVPALLVGEPGVGKTSFMGALARYMDVPLEVLTLNNREPTDVLGLHVVTESGLALEPPPFVKRLVKAGKGILFFDEYTTSPPALQAASLRVIQERMFGDTRLPDDVAIVLAANPVNQAANGYDLSAPAANRLYHLSCELDPLAWVGNTLAGWPDAPMPVPPRCQPCVTQARAAVASFIQVRPNLLLNVPSDLTRAGEAWPSPRSWSNAINLLAVNMALYGEGVNLDRDLSVIAGCVGTGAAMEFLQYREHLDLPDPEAVLADPLKFPLDLRADKIEAVLGSITAHVLAHLTPERYAAAWKVIGRVVDKTGAPDVAAIHAMILAPHCKGGMKIPAEATKLLPLLAAIGKVA